MNYAKAHWRNLWWVFSFITMAACGGGGSSGVSGSGALSIAEQVSVVDAADEGNASLSAKSLTKGLRKSVSDLPADSDYNNDAGFTYVAEHSAEAFSVVNEILCYLDQAQYDSELLLNTGAYVAQIDANECKSEKSDAGQAASDSQNQTSGSNAPNYEYWTLLSEREPNHAHFVSLWANSSDEGRAQTILGKVEITEAASSDNPYGLFHMDFSALDGESSEEMFHGYLQAIDSSDGVLLQFFGADQGGGGEDAAGGGGDMNQQATLLRSADGVSGSGQISGGEVGDTQIAYDADHFLRSDGSANVCLSRTEFDTSVWRYNLYQTENGDDPGARISMQGGFPIKFTDDASEEHHGFVGYWGLFVDGGADLESGDTVVKQSFGGGEVEETEYNVFIANGKLIKRTRETVTLAEIQGIPLDFGQCDDSGCTNYQVQWNGTGLFKTGARDPETFVLQEYGDEEIEELVPGEFDYQFSFWSQALGGDGRINLRDPATGDPIALTNDSELIFFRQQTVLPGEAVPEDLICFNNCPDPENIDGNDQEAYLTASTWQAGEASFDRLAQTVAPEIAEGALEDGTHFASYMFDTTDMLLKKDDVSVATTSASESSWGVHSGVMFEPSVENLAALECPWDENTTCSWRAYDNLEVSYTWETGKEQWSHLTLLQDPTDDSFLTFDQPIMVKYQDADGKSFYLDYAGSGELHGIPGVCVDMDTGAEISCHQAGGEGKHIRWVPEFSIPDGSVLTNVATDVEYYVKALDKEQRMIAVDESECADLTLVDYDLPEETLYVAPDIGDQPDVTAPPSVIGGELQIE